MGWKCPECNTINYGAITTCVYGYRVQLMEKTEDEV
jgi:hypothetical protein